MADSVAAVSIAATAAAAAATAAKGAYLSIYSAGVLVLAR